MTFKLRSGNSPKFKHMGSSPLKDNHDDGLGNPADDINKRTTQTKVDKLQDELDYKKKKAAEERRLQETTPWNEDVKAETATLKGQKGPKKMKLLRKHQVRTLWSKQMLVKVVTITVKTED